MINFYDHLPTIACTLLMLALAYRQEFEHFQEKHLIRLPRVILGRRVQLKKFSI